MRLGAQAFLIEHDRDTLDFVGNRTDCALLVLLRSWGLSYAALREVRLAVCGSCQEALLTMPMQQTRTDSCQCQMVL